MRGLVVAAMAACLGAGSVALAQEPRFDTTAERCLPYRKGVIDRQWQVSAPRNPQNAGVVGLGLRDKNGETGQRLLVRARIVGAGAHLDSKPVPLIDDHFNNVEHPRDFGVSQPLAPGIYTVVWTLADGGGFLACDGFVIR